MTDITVYTTGPSEVCSRVRHLLDARGFAYDLVQVETEQELEQLQERSGRMSCPLVYVGSELIGGFAETVAADRSGRLAKLAGA